MRIYSFSLIVLALTGAAHTFNLVTLDVVPPRSNTPSALPARSDLPTQLDKALPRSEACAQRAVSPNLSRRLSDLESANTERAPAMANRATGGSSTQEGRRPRSNSEALRRGLPLLRPFRRRSGYYPQPSCHPNKPCHHEA
ncbi:hypothetical protein CcaverHIS631_0500180 [Cutaneotrichosporon cavernicola]|nr:hypothetical protein CcaverHIS631_0500180 [Cutaneotrichosporon cavernicola]BEJ07932.1 hypothetical protein CcaverHIS641_0500170 [Cutaneotrichosporon cavernicola]